MAINTCPASNNPLRPPPKLPARFAAKLWPACTSPFNPPVNAATASGNDAPKLACNAALIWAASAGRLNPPARLAINTCPASNNPLRPPPKLPARLTANVWPACTSPFNPPVNAANNSGSDVPKLACNAADNSAANTGALRLAVKLPARVSPVWMSASRPPPTLPARFVAKDWPAWTRPVNPLSNAPTRPDRLLPTVAEIAPLS
ncbi:hypothetical protein KST_03826 [Mycobacterium marinum]|nr:hypothetical protein KST_03826 [Mycobacterium marinum]